MSMRKIFSITNKNKLRKLYINLLKKAIEEKESEYKQVGYEFDIKNDVMRVCGKINQRACKYYLQGLVLNIPFADWKIREEILNFLQIEEEAQVEYKYNEVLTLCSCSLKSIKS